MVSWKWANCMKATRKKPPYIANSLFTREPRGPHGFADPMGSRTPWGRGPHPKDRHTKFSSDLFKSQDVVVNLEIWMKSSLLFFCCANLRFQKILCLLFKMLIFWSILGFPGNLGIPGIPKIRISRFQILRLQILRFEILGFGILRVPKSKVLKAGRGWKSGEREHRQSLHAFALSCMHTLVSSS